MDKWRVNDNMKGVIVTGVQCHRILRPNNILHSNYRIYVALNYSNMHILFTINLELCAYSGIGLSTCRAMCVREEGGWGIV